MKFTKMHGAGNDYIFVNCFTEELFPSDRPALAKKLSHRNFGVGGDGLICICPSDIADFQMDIYNADGSRGLMCGNGIRCVGKYVYDRGMTTKSVLSIETAAGVKTLWLDTRDGVVSGARVDMGSPSFVPEDIPAKSAKPLIRQPLEIDGRKWEITALSVGNPHAVVFIDEDVDSLQLSQIGPGFENHPMFPERINTEFVNVISGDHLKMRVWERGSGETMACGTGATAALAAANVCGLCGESAVVSLTGGELFIEWDKGENKLYMTGAAESVFDGETRV